MKQEEAKRKKKHTQDEGGKKPQEQEQQQQQQQRRLPKNSCNARKNAFHFRNKDMKFMVYTKYSASNRRYK